MLLPDVRLQTSGCPLDVSERRRGWGSEGGGDGGEAETTEWHREVVQQKNERIKSDLKRERKLDYSNCFTRCAV